MATPQEPNQTDSAPLPSIILILQGVDDSRLERSKRSTEHLSHFCQRFGGYGIYATRLSIV
jgi:hypothetical protein